MYNLPAHTHRQIRHAVAPAQDKAGGGDSR